MAINMFAGGAGGVPRFHQTPYRRQWRVPRHARAGHAPRERKGNGYASASQPASLAAPLTVNLILEPAARVGGRVIDRATNEPVAGADVMLAGDKQGPHGSQRKSDEAGRCEFADVAAGNDRVTAREGGLTGVSNLVAVTITQSVEGVEVFLDPGRTTAGPSSTKRGARSSTLACRRTRRIRPSNGRVRAHG